MTPTQNYQTGLRIEPLSSYQQCALRSADVP